MRLLGGKGVLLLAILLGVATSYISWRYVQEASAASNPVHLVPVVVATKPIPQRTIIKTEMLQVKHVPADARPQGAYTDPTQVVGKVSKAQLAIGEHLMPHQLFLQREKSGLAFMIPDSRRAIAVAVSEVIGTGGLIIPGDRVDVYALFDLKEPERAAAPAFPSPTPIPYERVPQRNTMIALILQNVEVLAVAQSVEGVDPRGTNEQLMDQVVGQSNGANGTPPTAKARPVPQARTVTVSVTPADAEKLILAEERGKIRLALRPAAEQGQVEVEPLELRQVVQEPTR